MSIRILFLYHDGMEELEAIAPLDILRRAGCQVTTVSVSKKQKVTSKNGVPIEADELANGSLDTEKYQAIVIPGGPGVAELRKKSFVGDAVAVMAVSGKWVAAICAAPLVLLDQQLLEDRSYTAHQSTLDELPLPQPGAKVVVDGNIITSRGAGTALDFGLKLVEIFISRKKAHEIAQSIEV